MHNTSQILLLSMHHSFMLLLFYTKADSQWSSNSKVGFLSTNQRCWNGNNDFSHFCTVASIHSIHNGIQVKRNKGSSWIVFFRIHMLAALYSTRFEEMARKSRLQLFYRTFALSVVCDGNNGRATWGKPRRSKLKVKSNCATNRELTAYQWHSGLSHRRGLAMTSAGTCARTPTHTHTNAGLQWGMRVALSGWLADSLTSGEPLGYLNM